MKKFSIFFLGCLVLGLLVSCASVPGRRSSLPPGKPLDLSEVILTGEQKAQDMAYLFKKLRLYKPYAAEMSQAMGLPPLLEEESLWVEKARNSLDNVEFFRLVDQVRCWMMQTGHADRGEIYLVKDLEDYPDWAGILEFKPIHQDRMGYWNAVGSHVSPEAHSRLPLKYEKGKYFLKEGIQLPRWNESQDSQDLVEVPAGSQILRIQGLAVDEWVRQAAFKNAIFYDPKAKKLFNLDPFLTLDPRDYGWKTEFQVPEGQGSLGPLFVKGYLGNQVHQEYVRDIVPNVAPLMLRDDVAYLRIRDFSPKGGYVNEIQTMQNFIKGLKPGVKDLILDVRGNRGGDNTVWLTGLVYPLAKKEIRFTTPFRAMKVLKEKILEFPGLLNKDLEPVSGDRVTYDVQFLREAGDYVDLQGTVVVKPMKEAPGFSGRVTILSGRRSYSSVELMNMFFQETGLGRLAGEHSRGGGGGHGLFIFPLPIMLPHSGIVLTSETATAPRKDGGFWSTYCAQPDLWLPSQRGPFDITPESLLKDPWVQAVLKP